MKTQILFMLFISIVSLFSCKKSDDGYIDNRLKIADTYQGGIVAYILQPNDWGYDQGLQHGLIIAPLNAGLATWGCYTTDINPYYSDLERTEYIASTCPEDSIAAKICLDYVNDGYDDWFLGSHSQMIDIFSNKYLLGDRFLGDNEVTYWSSSSSSIDYSAYSVYASYDAEHNRVDREGIAHVCPVRKF